jgi:hypothetical protein
LKVFLDSIKIGNMCDIIFKQPYSYILSDGN